MRNQSKSLKLVMLSDILDVVDEMIDREFLVRRDGGEAVSVEIVAEKSESAREAGKGVASLVVSVGGAETVEEDYGGQVCFPHNVDKEPFPRFERDELAVGHR